MLGCGGRIWIQKPQYHRSESLHAACVATGTVMQEVVGGRMALVWCSQVHHSGFSSRRPGFESRHEHLTQQQSAAAALFISSEGSIVKIFNRLIDLFSGIHDERTVP